MKARSYISIAVCLGFALAGAPRVLHADNAPQKGQKFKLGCTLPFDGIKQDRDIDNDCPQGGDAAAGPHQNQNMIKNNFCAGGKTNDDDPCKSVTAEISPHFRPETWADFDQYDRTHPVRITGQLFFDGSHAPCRNGKRPNPQRASIWEIHPVYAIEVCKNKSLAGCATTNKSVWIPFDQWATVDDEEDSGNR